MEDSSLQHTLTYRPLEREYGVGSTRCKLIGGSGAGERKTQAKGLELRGLHAAGAEDSIMDTGVKSGLRRSLIPRSREYDVQIAVYVVSLHSKSSFEHGFAGTGIEWVPTL